MCRVEDFNKGLSLLMSYDVDASMEAKEDVVLVYVNPESIISYTDSFLLTKVYKWRQTSKWGWVYRT